MDDTAYPCAPQLRRHRLRPRDPYPYDPLVHEEDADSSVVQPASVTFPPILPTNLPADIVLGRLRALGLRIRGSGPWQASCPAHRDPDPSLSLTETAEGVLLMHCWGGCKKEAVLARLGLGSGVFYPSLYALQCSKRRPQGAIHFHGGKDITHIVEPTAEEIARWERRLDRWAASREAFNRLAHHLGLPKSCLKLLHVGFDSNRDCWVFPERADKGQIVGLVRRYANGDKRTIMGSKRGLTIPDFKRAPAGPIYLVEGASDTAALVSAGAFVIGRSNAQGGALERLWLIRLLAGFPGREIVVVGEREESGVGKRGAEELAAYLHETLRRPVTWALPRKAYKDSREQVVAGKWSKGLITQEVLQ